MNNDVKYVGDNFDSELAVGHEVVKYDNHLNSMNLSVFSKSELNVFLALLAQAVEKDTDSIYLTAAQLKSLSGMKRQTTKLLIQVVDCMFAKAKEYNFKYFDEKRHKIVTGVLFTTTLQDPITGDLQVRVNPEAAPVLNDLENQYTMYLLPDFVHIRSKYAKIMYMNLMQWRTTNACLTWNLATLQHKMGYPQDYPTSKVTQRVINPIKRELNKLVINFQVTPVKRGRRILGYTFSYDRMAKLVNPTNSQLKRIGELDRIAADKKHRRELAHQEARRRQASGIDDDIPAYKGPEIPFIDISDPFRQSH